MTVESVDLSATYGRWAGRTCKEWVQWPDVSVHLMRAYLAEAERGRMYDAVILDPEFSNSRKMEHDFDVQRVICP